MGNGEGGPKILAACDPKLPQEELAVRILVGAAFGTLRSAGWSSTDRTGYPT